MKLSKSQRLFIQVGRIEYLIDRLKLQMKHFTVNGLNDPSRMKELKQKRKKLIREAVEAAQDEYQNFYEEGLRAGYELEWEI